MSFVPFPYGPPPRPHPQGRTILVLGIVSLLFCQLLGPGVWAMANRAMRDIDESQGTQAALVGRETVYAGRILGMIASGFLGFWVIGALVSVLLDILA